MFTLVKGVYEEISKRDEYFIAILGLDGSGKTTYLEMVKRLLDVNNKHDGRDLHKIASTVGLNHSKIVLSEFILNLWDLGGQAELRYIWDNYLKECHAVVFVVDSIDSQRFIEAITSLEQILSNENVKKLPFLVLLNKCDSDTDFLQNGYKDKIVEDDVNMSEISKERDAHYTIQSTSSGWQSFDLENSNEEVINGEWDQNSDCCSSFSLPIPLLTSEVGVIKSEIYNRLEEVLQGDMAIFSISARQNAGVKKTVNWLINALKSKKKEIVQS